MSDRKAARRKRYASDAGYRAATLAASRRYRARLRRDPSKLAELAARQRKRYADNVDEGRAYSRENMRKRRADPAKRRAENARRRARGNRELDSD